MPGRGGAPQPVPPPHPGPLPAGAHFHSLPVSSLRVPFSDTVSVPKRAQPARRPAPCVSIPGTSRRSSSLRCVSVPRSDWAFHPVDLPRFHAASPSETLGGFQSHGWEETPCACHFLPLHTRASSGQAKGNTPVTSLEPPVPSIGCAAPRCGQQRTLRRLHSRAGKIRSHASGFCHPDG